MVLTIAFRAPSRTELSAELNLHERCFGTVPSAVVETIIRDFAAYHSTLSACDQRELYRYEASGEERVLAVDFQEVIAIITEDGTVGFMA